MYLKDKALRIKENFNQDWFFYHGEESVPGGMDTFLYRPVKLPHDWSIEYPWDEKAVSCGSGGYAETGIGWYKKLFSVDPEALARKVLLHFEGVYMLAQVWINGTELGTHVYGYTPFEWDITEYLYKDGKENVVDVKVDNSAQPSSRWYSGSGITRNVWIQAVNDIHVAPYGVYVRQKDVSQKKAVLTIETKVCTCGSVSDSASVVVETTLYDPDGLLCMQKQTITGNTENKAVGIKSVDGLSSEAESNLAFYDSDSVSYQIVTQDFEITGPKLWKLEEPSLYKIVTKVFETGIQQDEVTMETGLRNIAFDCEKGFLLNGERVKLNGVCIHHDGGCVGAAVHPQIWERRLTKLKNMGVNALRTAHNPPDPALLDLCDRMGMMVMDEAFDEWQIVKWKELGSNTSDSKGYSDWFDQCHEEDLRTMLLRDRNHPCIILWSIGNEVPEQTTEDGYKIARHLKNICRELDPDRMVTQGNDQICAEPNAAREEFLNELDVVGYNYVNRWRTRMETLYDDDKRAYPNRCVIGTENGSLGGVRGEYLLSMQDRAGWWKHPYYSGPVVIGKLLHFTMTHDYVAGDFMWTGIDYLGEAHWPAHAASAGVLDTCGFEKDSYYFYKSIWNQAEPMVHLLPHWNLEIEEGTILPVLGFTNCESAELFLNGKSYGRKAYSYPAYGMTERYGHFDKEPVPVNTDDLFLSWDVPYEPGCIELIGYNEDAECARQTVRTAGEPVSVKLSAYCDTLKNDNLDIAQIEVRIVDAQGNLCVQADKELHFQIQGPAGVIAVDNGNNESMESMKADHIHAFHGMALAVIQSDKTEAEMDRCIVSVTAEGLIGDSLILSILPV